MSLRFLFALVFAFAAIAVARPPAAAASDFTPDQKKEIEGIVRDYLKTHPEMLIDAIQAADDKLKADAKDKSAQALASHRQQVFDDPQSPVAGNPKGDVSLVEFFDYRCPYCKQVEPALEKLIGDDRQLRFVYKEFPVLGPDSETAARVALAAKKQGRYDAAENAFNPFSALYHSRVRPENSVRLGPVFDDLSLSPISRLGRVRSNRPVAPASRPRRASPYRKL